MVVEFYVCFVCVDECGDEGTKNNTRKKTAEDLCDGDGTAVDADSGGALHRLEHYFVYLSKEVAGDSCKEQRCRNESECFCIGGVPLPFEWIVLEDFYIEIDAEECSYECFKYENACKEKNSFS